LRGPTEFDAVVKAAADGVDASIAVSLAMGATRSSAGLSFAVVASAGWP
jgi:hypothetical protein